MKKYLVLLSAVFVSYTMSAQFTIGVDGGLSIPYGDYGSSGTSASGGTINGFAKLGSCYDAYVGFKFLPIIGVMAQYGANMNSFNTSDLGENFTSSGGYTVSEYLIGPYLSIKLVKIKIEVKLLGGLVSSNYPTISESTTLSGVSTSVVNSFSTGNAFGYCAGAKVKYMFGSILGIGLGLDYVGSDIDFKGVSTVNSQTASNSYKMSVGVLQATLGVSVDL